MAYKRTRVKAQDMKTGEFAYLDELIKDGYFPDLWVLPKNYDPPQPVGQSMRLPLEPIFNYSPPNFTDSVVVPVIAQINQDTGMAVLLPNSEGLCGLVRQSILQQLSGIASSGLLGSVFSSISRAVTGVASVGALGSLATPSIASPGLTGIVTGTTTGATTINVTGQASPGLLGAVLSGSGWGQGGGWGSNGWGTA